MVWHAGLSASIPLQLSVSTPEALAKMTGGAVQRVVPTSETIFAPFNLIICAILIFGLPIVNALIQPSKRGNFEDPALWKIIQLI